MNPLNITDTQMVALKCWVACLLEVTLLGIIGVCLLHAVHVETAVLIEAIGFVCAIAGVSYTSFRTQRLTNWKYVELKGEADAKIAEATKPSAVSVTTPTTTVNTPTGP